MHRHLMTHISPISIVFWINSFESQMAQYINDNRWILLKCNELSKGLTLYYFGVMLSKEEEL